MNSTMAASDLSGALLPQAWAGSLPGVSLALLALAISIWFFQASDDWAKLPGPPPASKLLGHLPQMNVLNVHRFWQDSCQKYGAKGMFKVRLLHMKVVVVSDPVLIQAIVSRASDLPKAAQLYDTVDELFSPVGHRSFFNTHDNDEWRVVRKTTAPAFSPAMIRKAFPKLMDVTSELCDALAAKVAAGESSVEMSEAAMRVTLDVIGSTGYGYDFKARTFARCELFEIIPPLLGEFTLRSTNPARAAAHRCLPFLPEARRFRQRVQACHKWWRILLASVRQTDLAAAAAEGDTSLRVCLAQLPFTDEQLMPNVAAYLIAGFETTAHSIAWSLYEVASNPAVQRRLEAELCGAGLLGPAARRLEFGDLAALPFLNCVLKEAMRLHPVASNGSIRKADKEISLGGYRLAPGTLLWIPFIALLTSRHNWERADEFWPERWELEGQAAAATGAASGPTPVGNASNPALTYLPFSSGPRDCIGQNLALMEARAVIASIVGRFELGVAPEMGSREDVRNDEVMKLTLQCSKGIRLTLKPRQ